MVHMTHYFTDNRDLPHHYHTISFTCRGRSLSFVSDSGVFSKDEVDTGSEILIEAALDAGVNGEVLDMGCGYGTIGITVGVLVPSAKITMADINPRACELAEANAAKNETDCRVLVSDGFTGIEGRFDWILMNPPIRTGKKVIYPMFRDAFAHLKEGGTMLAVIRRKQGAESALKMWQVEFGSGEVISREKGFWILKSKRLTG